MFKFSSSKRLRASALALVSGSILFIAAADPALALCKYGTPHCVNPHRPELHAAQAPTIDGTGNGWEDPDCQYYGNCLSQNHDTGCWYVNGVCRPNPQPTPPPTPPRHDPDAHVTSHALTTLQTSH
ncbi:MAG: hypothetical protein ABUL73_03185 [Alphaproteobacteria bacterium]